MSLEVVLFASLMYASRRWDNFNPYRRTHPSIQLMFSPTLRTRSKHSRRRFEPQTRRRNRNRPTPTTSFSSPPKTKPVKLEHYPLRGAA
jgi:hypothetical protein